MCRIPGRIAATMAIMVPDLRTAVSAAGPIVTGMVRVIGEIGRAICHTAGEKVDHRVL